MVTHWESSTRPLFVKTVWRDGQHHVVLRNEDDPVARRNINSSSSNGSARSIRSSKTVSSNSNKVSSASVTLLLTGVGTFNSADQTLKRCKNNVSKSFKTATDLNSHKESSTTLRNIRSITPEYKVNRNINLSVKSNSIDTSGLRETKDNFGAISPYFSYSNYIEPYNNSLSERVMVWLDLATQNGNYTKEINKIQPQPIVTACHISQNRQHTAIKRKCSVNYKLNVNCDRNGNLLHVEGSSQTIQSTLNRSSSDDEENVLFKKTSASPKQQLCSEVEENIVVENLQQLPRKPMNTVKRQLHIFIPHLPQKFSDCDSSLLSSKISTSSLQRSIQSRIS